jgi:hypothetical protein
MTILEKVNFVLATIDERDSNPVSLLPTRVREALKMADKEEVVVAAAAAAAANEEEEKWPLAGETLCRFQFILGRRVLETSRPGACFNLSPARIWRSQALKYARKFSFPRTHAQMPQKESA